MTTESEQNDADGEVIILRNYQQVLLDRSHRFVMWMSANYPGLDRMNEYDWDAQYDAWLSVEQSN